MKFEFLGAKIDIGFWEFLAGLGLLFTPSPAKMGISTLTKGDNMSEGIGALEAVVALVAEIAQDLKKAKEDGKIDLADAGLLFPIFTKSLPVMQQVSQLGVEVKDLDASEVQKLAGESLAALGLSDPKMSVYVQEGFNIVVSAFKIIKA